jgi:hypothetical protein
MGTACQDEPLADERTGQPQVRLETIRFTASPSGRLLVDNGVVGRTQIRDAGPRS